MARARLNIENGIRVTSVGNYLEAIKDIVVDFESNIFAFRGQKTEYWDIQSSLFRENKLNIEYKLMNLPLTKFPTEFDKSLSQFDIMAKYQHYGLCTRLLDLTTNPLVALYFACQKNGEEEYDKDPELIIEGESKVETIEPWGIVYFCFGYPLYSNSIETKIISYLSQKDLESENSLQEILKALYSENIISEEQKDRWSKKEYYCEFIDIIQKNYVVSPTYNNERLKCQKGLFLLPGLFSINSDNNGDLMISKSCKSLRGEFNEKFFYVDGDLKDYILKELDLCNINESTLFPELEHQLNYIKETNSVSLSSPDFIKFDPELINNSKVINLPETIDYEEFSKMFDKNFQEYLQKNYSEDVASSIYKIFVENSSIDWYKKDSIKAKIRISIEKNLIQVYHKGKKAAKEISIKCLDKITLLITEIIRTNSENNIKL